MRKANIFKRTLSGVLALSSALTVGLFAGCSCNDDGDGDGADATEQQAHAAFIDEIGGVSETYKGTLSNGNYYLHEDAAEAFVAAEVSSDAEVINVTKLKALNADEVAALNIPATSKTISGVEKYEVEYTEDPYATMSTQTTGSKKVVVYLIRYDDGRWEYFSPCPVTGETITKSYYDSVFNSDAYENCTYRNTMTMNMSVDASMQGQAVNISASMSMTQLMKYQDGKIYMEQSISNSYTMTMTGMDSETETENTTVYAYIEDTQDGMACYVKMVEGDDVTDWTKAPLYTIGISSVEDLLPFADGYLDYTYFTKTDFGFELSGEQADRYIAETMDSIDSMPEVSNIIDQMDVKTIVKYYVQNGALTGLRQDLNLGYSGVIEGANTSLSLTLVVNGTVKDYGTTVVTKPAEIAE